MKGQLIYTTSQWARKECHLDTQLAVRNDEKSLPSRHVESKEISPVIGNKSIRARRLYSREPTETLLCIPGGTRYTLKGSRNRITSGNNSRLEVIRVSQGIRVKCYKKYPYNYSVYKQQGLLPPKVSFFHQILSLHSNYFHSLLQTNCLNLRSVTRPATRFFS